MLLKTRTILRLILLLVALLTLTSSYGCYTDPPKYVSFQEKWNHVHHSFRLETLKDSIVVKGVVYKIEKCLDGDLDIELRLLPPYDSTLLSSRNYTVRDSCLVVEIVCNDKTFLSACDCYQNTVTIPQLHDTCVVSGSYIWDRMHRWTEIHPVQSLVVIHN